jgi:hypothetical protein
MIFFSETHEDAVGRLIRPGKASLAALHRIVLTFRRPYQRPAIHQNTCEVICRVRRSELRDQLLLSQRTRTSPLE